MNMSVEKFIHNQNENWVLKFKNWIATPTLWAREDDCGKCPLSFPVSTGTCFARSASDEAIQPFFLSSLRGALFRSNPENRT
jgi:hypothetical protein